MALEKQLVDFPLAAGVDTRNDEGSPDPQKNTDILNMRFTNPGALRPTEAFTATTYSVLSPTAYGALNINNRLYQMNTTGLLDYDNLETTAFTFPGAAQRTIVGGQAGSTCYSTSTTYIDGRIFVCWAMTGTTTGVGYQWLSLSGELLFAGGFSTANAPKQVIVTDTYATDRALVWMITGSGALACSAVDYGDWAASTLTVPSLSNLTHISVTHNTSDISTSTPAFYIAYYTTSATTTYVSKYTLTSSTLSAAISPVTVTTSAILALDIIRTDDYVTVGYVLAGTSPHKIVRYSTSLTGANTSDLTTGLSLTALSMGFGLVAKPSTTNTIGITLSLSETFSNGSSNYNSASYVYGWELNLSGTTPVSKGGGTPFAVRFVSRPMYINSTLVVMAVDMATPGYETHALVAFPSSAYLLVPTMVWDCGEASGYPSSSTALVISNRMANYNGVYYFAGASISDYVSTSSSTTAGTALPVLSNYNTSVSILKFDTGELPYLAQHDLDTNTVVVTPQVYGLDGSGVSPNFLWPAPYLVGGGQAGGSLTNGQTYIYVIEKLWRDAQGNEYRVESHPIQFLANASNQTCRIYLAAYEVIGTVYYTASSAPRIVIYRSEGNGTIPYYLTTVSAGNTYYDDTGGTLDLTRPLLSTAGDLPTIGAAIPKASCIWKQRLVCITADYPRSIYYTAPIQSRQAPMFKSGLRVDFLSATSDLVAVTSMDGILYAFTEDQTFTLYGDPAGVTGENSTLSLPELRFNNIGATSAHGVLLTANGIIVHSKKGFYLIARNQEKVYIGDGPFEDRAHNIVGSYINQTTQEAIFVFDDRDTDPVANTNNCKIWCYDLVQNVWFKRGFSCANDPVALTVYDETLRIWTSSNYYTEAATSETLTAYESPWIRLGSLQGYQRLYNILLKTQLLTACDITIDLYLDYNDTSVYTWSLDSTTLTLTQGTIKLSAPYQKCEAFKLRIYMESQSGGGNLVLQGITAEIGVKPTTYKQSTGPNNS